SVGVGVGGDDAVLVVVAGVRLQIGEDVLSLLRGHLRRADVCGRELAVLLRHERAGIELAQDLLDPLLTGAQLLVFELQLFPPLRDPAQLLPQRLRQLADALLDLRGDWGRLVASHSDASLRCRYRQATVPPVARFHSLRSDATLTASSEKGRALLRGKDDAATGALRGALAVFKGVLMAIHLSFAEICLLAI